MGDGMGVRVGGCTSKVEAIALLSGLVVGDIELLGVITLSSSILERLGCMALLRGLPINRASEGYKFDACSLRNHGANTSTTKTIPNPLRIICQGVGFLTYSGFAAIGRNRAGS